MDSASQFSEDNQPEIFKDNLEAALSVKIELTAQAAYSYLLYHNHEALIQSITITNPSNYNIEGEVIIKITAPRLCLKDYEKKIIYIPSNQTLQLCDIDLPIDPDFLLNLKERCNVDIQLEITVSGVSLAKKVLQIPILVINEWDTSFRSEFLASFIVESGVHLKAPYQTKSKDEIKDITRTIYKELAECNLEIEEDNPFIKLPDAILQTGKASALDMALFFASKLETASLHPLLLKTSSKYLCGVWLVEGKFAEPLEEDISLLAERLPAENNEILIFDPTDTINKNFEEACLSAESQTTNYIIDIHRARLSGITPFDAHSVEFEEPLQDDSDTPIKLKQWQRKLLDLGLRNSLINLKLSRSVIQLKTTSLMELNNELADGKEFKLLPDEIEQNEDYIKAGKLITNLSKETLQNTLKQLYRTARKALEENGAGTLYITLGLIRWSEKKDSEHLAPLVLIPIELIRKPAMAGYTIKMRDDDPFVNVTILEKFKQDFKLQINGLDPAPLKDGIVDLKRIIEIVKHSIQNQNGWEILESATIGMFSFSQFVMWNDLRNHAEDLTKNKIVDSLVERKLTWEASPLDSTTKISEDGIVLPLIADATQLHAIKAAAKGESFVLHGPPGTGKSQTITSLIVNALSDGKTVLFVAEKKAALDVVQKRLSKIGIKPFCLELHSNNSKKRDVLEQFRQTLEVTKYEAPESYKKKAQEIKEVRAKLDLYVEHLHKKQSFGENLFNLINCYEKYRSAPTIPSFNKETFSAYTSDDFSKIETLLNKTVSIAKSLGHPKGHPLARIARTDYNQEFKIKLEEALQRYKTVLSELEVLIQNLPTPTDETTFSSLFEIVAEFKLWLTLPKAWLGISASRIEELKEYLSETITINEIRARLKERFDEKIFNEDPQQLFNKYKEAKQKWFIPRYFAIGKLLREIKVFGKCKRKEIGGLINDLLEIQKEKDLKCDETLLIENSSPEETQKKVTSALNSLLKLKTLGVEECDLLKYCDDSSRMEQFNKILDLKDSFYEKQAAFYTLLSIRTVQDTTNYITSELELCDNVEKNKDFLKEWIAFEGLALELSEYHLNDLVECYRNGLSHQDFIPAYKKALSHALILKILADEPYLNSFSGIVFNEQIAYFKKLDDEMIDLAKKEAYCRLAAKVPNFTIEASQNSELGILQRMIKSGGRGMALRTLFEQIPNLFPRLCPCVLMSPISVAQYLGTKQANFDLVVFDEASQLPTCKAVGALARGKSAIVVGDPNQMPPTSFFATNITDEDNLDCEDLENILDDCLALGMPEEHLLWHYRSRHESLIAFSNSEFYENKLFTFPSPYERESKVIFNYIKGTFERGKKRYNRAEAEAVVHEIQRRYQDSELKKQSIGVVTFSIAQQNLIDDLLDDITAKDQDFDNWLNNSAEPVFIKNLENVQGDERDVILFSIGYGADEHGKLYMNFGPLNRDGGWRRLNVAVTRSRTEMQVFSSIKPEELDLSRTSAKGVASLKAFLEYAAGKKLTFRADDSSLAATAPTALAHSIAEKLREYGYEVDLAVGASPYRVDIGVVDKKKTGSYILGVLLDGYAYASALSTHDREFSQESVLRGLGWNIIRIWSMDWWDNSEKEFKRILARLNEIENGITIPQETTQKAEEIEELKSLNQEITLSPYKETVLEGKKISTAKFYSSEFELELSSRIREVINFEAPINATLLYRRVLNSLDQKASAKAVKQLQKVMSVLGLKRTSENGELFFWTREQNPDECYILRTGAAREISELPEVEIRNAITVILLQQISMPREALVRELTKLFGFARKTEKIETRFNLAIENALKAELIELTERGIYQLTETGTTLAKKFAS